MNDLEHYRKELSEFSRRSFQRRLVGGTGGNLSVRIPDTDTVLITPTAISLGDVKPEENILVRLDGEVVESPMGLKASKEAGGIPDSAGCGSDIPCSSTLCNRVLEQKHAIAPFHRFGKGES